MEYSENPPKRGARVRQMLAGARQPSSLDVVNNRGSGCLPWCSKLLGETWSGMQGAEPCLQNRTSEEVNLASFSQEITARAGIETLPALERHIPCAIL